MEEGHQPPLAPPLEGGEMEIGSSVTLEEKRRELKKLPPCLF